MKSIKTKFVAIISSLIIAALVLSGYFLIDRKSKELTHDIYINARSFAELTTPQIKEFYDLYYLSKSFAFFQREITNVFSYNEDISRIRIASYKGEIFYDSQEEKDKQYEGEARKIEDIDILNRLKDIKPSVKTTKRDKPVYMLKDELGKTNTVDILEKPIPPISNTERIKNIIYPYSDNKTRLIYDVTYKHLNNRIRKTLLDIFLFLVITCGSGVIIAFMFSNKIVKPIKDLTVGAKEIGRGNLKYQVAITTKDEISILAKTFNVMARDLDKSTKALIEKEKISRELEIAGKIQTDLLPKIIPKTPGLDIAASVNPAEDVGGDCYDFINLDQDNTLIYVGDVTGHGVPAGLVVAITNALVFAYTKDIKNTRDIVIKTNSILKAKTQANMFITMCVSNWNARTKKFTYTSAGHEQTIHYQAKTGKTILHPSGGMAVGMLPDISKIVNEREIVLGQNDFLVFYTDGIPEAWKDQKTTLGIKGFQNIIEKYGKLKSAKKIHDAVYKDIRAFMGNYPQADDITLIIIKRTGA